MNSQNLLSNEKLRAAFNMFDKDGSGSISADEIKSVLGFGKSSYENEIQKIVQQVDIDGNG
jgi:calmodulin